MAVWHCDCLKCHSVAHFKMIEGSFYVMWILYQLKNISSQYLGDISIQLYTNQCNHYPICGQPGCFQLFAITNHTSVKTSLIFHIYTCVFSIGQIPCSIIIELEDVPLLSFDRYCQKSLQKDVSMQTLKWEWPLEVDFYIAKQFSLLQVGVWCAVCWSLQPHSKIQHVLFNWLCFSL